MSYRTVLVCPELFFRPRSVASKLDDHAVPPTPQLIPMLRGNLRIPARVGQFGSELLNWKRRSDRELGQVRAGNMVNACGSL